MTQIAVWTKWKFIVKLPFGARAFGREFAARKKPFFKPGRARLRGKEWARTSPRRLERPIEAGTDPAREGGARVFYSPPLWLQSSETKEGRRYI